NSDPYFPNHPAIDLKKILTDEALKHLPQTRNECITKTVSQGYWATAIPKDQFRAGADLSAVLKVAAANEPANLRIRVPTLVVQGTADDTVLPVWTDAVVKAFCKNGNSVFYTKYPGAGHETVVQQSATQVRSWIDARFGGVEAESNCPAR
ncbi:MAG: lipase family protein, partial [Herbaspirillum sp.]